MAIASALLGSVASTSAATTYTTAETFTPAAAELQVAIVYNRLSGGAGTATISGCGLTWSSILARTMELGGTAGRLEVFGGTAASPSNGQVTATFGANQDGCILSVIEFTGCDLSGGVAGAIVQSASNQSAGSTTPNVTMSAFASEDNAGFGAFAGKLNGTFTADTGEGYTERHNLTFNTPNSRYGGQWKIGSDASNDATLGASAEWGAIALEIKAAAGGGGGATHPGWTCPRGWW